MNGVWSHHYILQRGHCSNSDYMPLWPLCKNVKRNYRNGGDHTQKCAALVKPYYRAQPRICCKHGKWMVDSADLRTFRRDQLVQGASFLLGSVYAEGEGHLSRCGNTNIRGYNYRWFQQNLSSVCLFLLNVKKADLYTLWRLKWKASWLWSIHLWWAVINKLETKVIRCFWFLLNFNWTQQTDYINRHNSVITKKTHPGGLFKPYQSWVEFNEIHLHFFVLFNSFFYYIYFTVSNLGRILNY